MNRVNILFLFGVLCVLAVPSFAAPQKDPSDNEIGSDFNKDVETFPPTTNQGVEAPSSPLAPSSPVAPSSPGATQPPETPQFSGFSRGIIRRSGIDGTCKWCRKLKSFQYFQYKQNVKKDLPCIKRKATTQLEYSRWNKIRKRFVPISSETSKWHGKFSTCNELKVNVTGEILCVLTFVLVFVTVEHVIVH